MDLNLFNDLLNKAKDNRMVKEFINELSDNIERNVKREKSKSEENMQENIQDINQERNIENEVEETQEIKRNSLKEEGTLYQVVDMALDGAYLENKNDHKVYKETDISKDVWNMIGNDTILRYKDGEYIIEEELTQEFFDSLK